MDKREAQIIAERFINIVSKKYPVEKAWLFGSYARENNYANSDIDIPILIKNNYDIIDLQIDLMKMRRQVDMRIEPHPFTKKSFNESYLLRNEIEKYGVEMK